MSKKSTKETKSKSSSSKQTSGGGKSSSSKSSKSAGKLKSNIEKSTKSVTKSSSTSTTTSSVGAPPTPSSASPGKSTGKTDHSSKSTSNRSSHNAQAKTKTMDKAVPTSTQVTGSKTAKATGQMAKTSDGKNMPQEKGTQPLVLIKMPPAMSQVVPQVKSNQSRGSTTSKSSKSSVSDRGSYAGGVAQGQQSTHSRSKVYKQTSLTFKNPILLPPEGKAPKPAEAGAAPATQQLESSPSANDLGNVLSIPILTTTPSAVDNLRYASLEEIDSETSIAERTALPPVVSSKRTDSGEIPQEEKGPKPQASSAAKPTSKRTDSGKSQAPLAAKPSGQVAQGAQVTSEPSSTDVPITRNYVLSTTSLYAGHCGSGAPPRPPPIKRHLISARNILNGAMEPIGVLYGHIRSYLNCGTNSTHVLLRSRLVSQEGNDVALDICLVDEYDMAKVSKIFQMETKGNLVTVTPTAEGRVLFYDQIGRGIELVAGSHLKLDGDRISLVVGTIGRPKSPQNSSPAKGPSAASQLDEPLDIVNVDRKASEEAKTHKMDITSGTAMLLLWRTGPSYQLAMSTGAPATRIDLMVVVQDEKECGGIAIDEILLWDPRLHQAEEKKKEVQAVQVKMVDNTVEGNFPEVNYTSAEVHDYPLEYLILARTVGTKDLTTVGLVLGNIEGFLYSPPCTLKDIPGNSALLHLAVMDTHSRTWLTIRRKVLNVRKSGLVQITVGGGASVNLCGDQGGGWMVAAGSVLTLACSRLYQVSNCDKKGAAPPKLNTGTVVEVKDERARRVKITSGETTVLVTDSARSVAMYKH